VKKMTKTLLIHLRSGSMMNMDSNLAVKLARAALDKGHNVRIFGYGEGITAIKEGQEPKRFPPSSSARPAAPPVASTEARRSKAPRSEA
jgi:sulfur relay (sulfurtransferase) complex TusBCD TusD component (DsrE family)